MDQLISQIDEAASGALSDEIRLIKERRQALAQVIKLSLSVSRLQRSIESVVLLKKPSREIPKELLKALGTLSDKVTNLPTNELSMYLQRIEQTLKSDVEYITGIADDISILDSKNDDKKDLRPPAGVLEKLVNNFRRRANTAIVLRLHLRNRGVYVDEALFPVAPDKLVSQASKLAVEENRCRTEASKELDSMDIQIEKVLENSECPDAIRKVARSIKDVIKKNKDHLEHGRNIEKLPFAKTIIQSGEAEPENPEDALAPAATTTKGSIETVRKKAHVPYSDQESAEERSVKERMKIWITTPWSVSWKDTK